MQLPKLYNFTVYLCIAVSCAWQLLLTEFHDDDGDGDGDDDDGNFQGRNVLHRPTEEGAKIQ